MKLEQLLKDKFEDFEPEVDGSVWKNVENGLDKTLTERSCRTGDKDRFPIKKGHLLLRLPSF